MAELTMDQKYEIFEKNFKFVKCVCCYRPVAVQSRHSGQLFCYGKGCRKMISTPSTHPSAPEVTQLSAVGGEKAPKELLDDRPQPLSSGATGRVVAQPKLKEDSKMVPTIVLLNAFRKN